MLREKSSALASINVQPWRNVRSEVDRCAAGSVPRLGGTTEGIRLRAPKQHSCCVAIIALLQHPPTRNSYRSIETHPDPARGPVAGGGRRRVIGEGAQPIPVTMAAENICPEMQ